MKFRIPIFIIIMFAGRRLCTDVGFDLFFKTNLDEMTNVPIFFEKPLPEWINGTLIRNGLGRFEMGNRKFIHSFDAFAKLSSWRFPGNGTAYFSTRFLQTSFYNDSCRKKDIAPYLLFEGVIPKFNEAQKLEALVRGIDNMNVNVYELFNKDSGENEYVALNDYWKVYIFDQGNLETIGSYTAEIPKSNRTESFGFLNFLSSSHPLPEYGTTNHFTFLTSVSVIPSIKSTISLIRINSIEQRQLVAQWAVDKVPYMHSFSVTQNHAIFFASPFYVNIWKMIQYAEPFQCLDWFPDENTTVYVVNIHTGEVDTLTAANMFSMHFVNSFETENGNIVVDVSTYSSPDFVRSLTVDILLDPVARNRFDAHALLKRYSINKNSKAISVSLFETSTALPYSAYIDMPVINEYYRFQNYCYVYGIVLKIDNTSLSNISIVKKNVCHQPYKDASWNLKGHYPVEPWFIASPEAKSEDDGLLLFPVIDGERNASYIAIVDAKDMTLINKSYLPTILPYNLHGRFFRPDSWKTLQSFT